MSIVKLLEKNLKRTIFTTPSHNQNPLFSKNYRKFFKDDFSEIEGFDNLSNPKGSIFAAQGRAAEIIGSKQTFFLTQGATTGILASMKALINPGERVLAARNCHKSVYSGLIITAGFVDWFMPEIDKDWGIYTKIDPVKLDTTLQMNNYKVFIMTNPTYEGVNSDIKEIAQICRKNKVYLIVDESHGSLYNFSADLPDSAIASGADVSINSLHKTAGALNQCAILNISKNIQNIENETFQNAVNLFQTSSPSYPLLANIESCINFLNSENGRKKIDDLLYEIEKIKEFLIKFDIEFYEDENHDLTKIFLRKKGLTGFCLSDIMFNNFNIEDELNNSIGCLYLTGIGTTKQKLEKLKSALKKIKVDEFSSNEQNTALETTFQPYPLVKLQPVEAYNKRITYIKKSDSLLKISNELILPYPPGIGILYPGEAIQNWHLDYLNNDVKIII